MATKSSLGALLKRNPELGVDERLSGSKKPSEQEKIVRNAKRTALEHAFVTSWITVGGEHDFWEKIWIDGYPGYENKYEIDLYNAATRIGIEIQGGQYMDVSGHNSGKGLGRDARKLAKCHELGIDLFHIPTDMVTAEWAEVVMRLVKSKERR